MIDRVIGFIRILVGLSDKKASHADEASKRLREEREKNTRTALVVTNKTAEPERTTSALFRTLVHDMRNAEQRRISERGE